MVTPVATIFSGINFAQVGNAIVFLIAVNMVNLLPRWRAIVQYPNQDVVHIQSTINAGPQVTFACLTPCYFTWLNPLPSNLPY